MVTFSSNPVSWLLFLTVLGGAPLLSGIVNKFKARMAGRFGASVLQPYFDLVKLARKESVYSRSSGFITRLAPSLVWSTTALALLLLPVGPFFAAISFDGDFILPIYWVWAAFYRSSQRWMSRAVLKGWARAAKRASRCLRSQSSFSPLEAWPWLQAGFLFNRLSLESPGISRCSPFL